MMDQQIKERMVGAAVLVLAAVIFIPMLLSGPSQQRIDSASDAYGERTRSPSDGAQAPASDAKFSSRIVPINAPSSESGIDPEQTRSAIRTSASPPGSLAPSRALVRSRSEPASGSSALTQSASKPAAKASTTVLKSSERAAKTDAVRNWVVQLGSFASARNARALRDRLKSKGYKAFARSSEIGAQTVTRVYVGPDASREQAQQRVGRLLAETRLKGIVTRSPE